MGECKKEKQEKGKGKGKTFPGPPKDKMVKSPIVAKGEPRLNEPYGSKTK